MAYQARDRDPLFDSHVEEALKRRGVEALGFVLLLSGIAVALMLLSYVPEDPSWLAATDEPARNLLGRTGASLASPIHVTIGLAGWAIALHLVVWGWRCLRHSGEERAFSRAIFAPITIALAAVFCAGLVPPQGWAHSFGLGGLFGDTVMGAVVSTLPMASTTGLKALTFLFAAIAIASATFSLGVDRAEWRRFLRFLLLGVLLATSGLFTLSGRVTGGAGTWLRDRRDRRAAAQQAEPDPVPAPTSRVIHAHLAQAEHHVGAPAAPPQAQAPVLRAERPVLRAEPVMTRAQAEAEPAAPGGDRITARIADAIRSHRTRPAPEPAPAQAPTDVEPAFHHLDRHREAPQKADDALPTLVTTPAQQVAPPASAVPPRPVVQHTARRAAPSRQAQAEAQPAFAFEERPQAFEPPPLNLLTNPREIVRHHLSDEALEENARMLESVLDDYGVKGDIVSVRPGPVVTMYELEPAPGLKASRVIGLADDIARSMSALSARVSTVPGRSVIGIELPNAQREKVVLREILSARDYGDGNQRLPLALGKDIGGEPVVANLSKMPHLLIAGTTGSGKSVAINTMILSLLYKLTPDECRLIMIDPKMLELSVYDGIPHLLSPVVTDPKKAVVALKWVVAEMEERYRKMSKMGVRNIEGYNSRVRDALKKGELFSRTVQTGFNDDTGDPVFETEEFAPETLPYIVVIVDEMADLMMVAGKEIEACIQRLAQMARASGIHLIMATQRPSVDVITGTIKANFPTRISFQVTSKIDSRTILGEQGAEQLLGMGDMLYMAGGGKITRVHAPFVSDEEVEEVVNHLKSYGPPEYLSGVVEGPDEDKESDIDLVLGLGGNTDSEDAVYDQAVAVVLKDRKCSTSYIQRKLAIGYNKAARLVERMEDEGLVSPANHVGKREILVPEQ